MSEELRQEIINDTSLTDAEREYYLNEGEINKDSQNCDGDYTWCGQNKNCKYINTCREESRMDDF